MIATLINLLTQETVVSIYSGDTSLYLAMAVGTLAGLLSKYSLDKKFIFRFSANSQQEDLAKFLVYGLTGIATTALFWSFELGFEWLAGGKIARYIGAVIGLSIGYGVKYQLDKRYVFSRQDG